MKLVLLVIVSILLVGNNGGAHTHFPITNKDKATLVLGKALYEKNCASCHAINLSGAKNWKEGKDDDGQRLPPPLNGTAHTWHHSPEQLFQVIRYGYKKFDPNYKGKMLGNDDLSEDDVWSILEYIKSVWPKEIRDKYNNHFN